MITYLTLNGSFAPVPAQVATAVAIDAVVLIILGSAVYAAIVATKEALARKAHAKHMIRTYGARFAYVLTYNNADGKQVVKSYTDRNEAIANRETVQAMFAGVLTQRELDVRVTMVG